MSWSNSRKSIIQAIHSLACFSPSTFRSAASPLICCEFFTPPTASFSLFDLKPDVITTGCPRCSLRGSSTFVQRFLRFSMASASGVLLMPMRCAVEERTNSPREKCSLSFVDRLFIALKVKFVKPIGSHEPEVFAHSLHAHGGLNGILEQFQSLEVHEVLVLHKHRRSHERVAVV